LQDFVEKRDREKNPTKFKDQFAPTKDFSIKEGQKLQLSFGDGGTTKKQEKNP
jgi:hypothetical protein